MTGQQFDEVRVSRSIRYTMDFTPADAAFAADADTYLLMHLDGGYTAAAEGSRGQG